MVTNPFASTTYAVQADDQRRPRDGISYVAGQKDTPLAFTTVSAFLDQACDAYGSDTAAVFVQQDVSLSWNSLRERADELATGLLALGIRRGNRVAIWSPNRVEWLIAQFGTARIGAVLVNINPAYRAHELEFALTKVRARVLIMAPALKSSNYIDILRSIAPEISRDSEVAAEQAFYTPRLPSLKHIILLSDMHPVGSPDTVHGMGSVPPALMPWRELLSAGGPAHRRRLVDISATLDPDDAINIQFTSGTTGAPKGATLSHFNIVNNARYCAETMQLTLTDKVCIPVPLYHCFGMVIGVLACASVGAAMVFPGESFDATSTLQALQSYRCTALYGVPTMFITMLEHREFEQFDLGSLRTGVMAGAPCPEQTMRQVMDKMHMQQVTIAYGMTETSPVSFQSDVDDPIDRRVSTVGRVHPHVEVKIVNKKGRIVSTGEQGELCTRGYLVMQGYWDEPADSMATVIDSAGWMHTGDLAVLDSDGYCSIVGRVKDMVIRGGENIYPREIEEFLITHADVQDVQVFGIPDDTLGEAVCCWVIPKAGKSLEADSVKAFCKDAIAHFKVPSHVRIVTSFPMTVTGKPQKFDMRNQMIQQLLAQDTTSA